MVAAFVTPHAFRPARLFRLSRLSRLSNLCRLRMNATSPSTAPSALVSPPWLVDHLSDVTVLDASWHMPAANRDAHTEYLASRIPGAKRFDIDSPGLSDAASSLPHMLPTADSFATTVPALGVSPNRPVVVYSTVHFMGAARAWWMLRYFGLGPVYILDGGLPAWTAHGQRTDSGEPSQSASPAADPPTPLTVSESPQLLRTLGQMREQISAKSGSIIDARPAPRFRAETAEPRAGLRSGHMPGALNVPSPMLIDESGRLKPAAALRAVFESQGVQVDKLAAGPVSLTCGSGVTAAIVALALHELGVEAAVYDGSWSEYGAVAGVPVVS